LFTVGLESAQIKGNDIRTGGLGAPHSLDCRMQALDFRIFAGNQANSVRFVRSLTSFRFSLERRYHCFAFAYEDGIARELESYIWIRLLNLFPRRGPRQFVKRNIGKECRNRANSGLTLRQPRQSIQEGFVLILDAIQLSFRVDTKNILGSVP